MKIGDYTPDQDYKFSTKFNINVQAIDMTIEPLTSMEDTELVASILDISAFRTEDGKELVNDTSKSYFNGYQLISTSLEKTGEVINSAASLTSTAITATGLGAITFSSIVGHSVGFFTKMISILEFTALMELFNVDYDASLAKLLRAITNLTNFKIVAIPSESHMKKKFENTRASEWKGKLSRVGIAPWIMQDIGLLGLILVLIYIASAISLIFFKHKKFNKSLSMVRIQLFFALIVDYIGLTVRTLAHGARNKIESPLQNISFLVALFLLSCFVCEIIYLYKQVNTLYKTKSSDLSKF